MAKHKKITQQEPIEKLLWATADKLRKNIDAAEYKHIVLGLIFLKYTSDAFEEQYAKLTKEQKTTGLSDPEDIDEYQAENIFFIPTDARWSSLQKDAKKPDIGKKIDKAMDAIEKENPSLKGVLPKVYARENLDPKTLGELIDKLSNIDLGNAKNRSADVFGHVFEYFLGEFALAEGKKGGQFYTPRSVVQLLVDMLQPYQGRVFDPCCGSGGMFVQSEKFIKEHQGKVNNISIYGQESNQTTWRLCKMNLAIRRIDSSQVKWNSEGSFLKNAHKDLKADYIIANPPFNISDWSGASLRSDARWKYGTPPIGNANYAWVQHFLHHLAPNGHAGFVLSKGSLTSKTGGEHDIRRQLIEQGMIASIVNLPAKLFLNTQIPACLWFMTKPNTHSPHHKKQILFIDARHLGHLINRRTRTLSPEDIHLIAHTYHLWKNQPPTDQREQLTPPTLAQWKKQLQATHTNTSNTPPISYQNIPGFCHATPISQVAALDYVLTPGRYVGLPDEEDTFDFNQRFAHLKAQLQQQLQEEAILNQRLTTNLESIKLHE